MTQIFRCSFHYFTAEICSTHVSQVQLHQWFSNVSIHLNHAESLLKYRLVGSNSRAPDSVVGLAWGLRICISNEFSGNADAAGPGIISEIRITEIH